MIQKYNCLRLCMCYMRNYLFYNMEIMSDDERYEDMIDDYFKEEYWDDDDDR